MIFDIQPSEEVNLLRETVREFAAKEIAPIVGTPAAWLLHVSEHMLRGTLEAIQALGGNGDINDILPIPAVLTRSAPARKSSSYLNIAKTAIRCSSSMA